MAAATISTVAVVAMLVSGSPRRPLTFAGAILLPGSQSPTTSLAPATAASRPGVSPSRTPTVTVTPSTGGRSAPVARLIPASATNRVVPGMPGTATPGPAGAPAPATSSRPGTPRTSTPATPQSASNSTAIAHALFTALNKARRDAGLPPLNWNPRLQRSAAGHNEAMAQADQLSPRVGDEPALGARQANQGVLGSYAAEVIGNTATMSSAGAQAVQQAMLAEQAPNDGHRQTLLSSGVDTVGIDVLIDPAHGRLWITEDFAQLS